MLPRVNQVVAESGSLPAAKKLVTVVSLHHVDPHELSDARVTYARMLARSGRPYEARVACEGHEPGERLRVYATIVSEYAKRFGPPPTPVGTPPP
jgi:hypothetical protein